MIQKLDETLFLFFNNLHTPYLDQMMYFITSSNPIYYLPFYSWLLFLIFKYFRQKFWIIFMIIIWIIFCCDQYTSSILKPYFARLRPCHYFSLLDFHFVKGCGGSGLYGFPSSHAANTAGVATFLGWIFPPKKNIKKILLLWVLLVSYSRIYVGVHYPGDILAGMMIGILMGSIGFYSIKKIIL